MKRIFIKMLLIVIVTELSSCSKGKNYEENKTAFQLLTERQWILTGHGFDDNKNHHIDSNENAAAECMKDNTYIFRPGGSGTNYENDNLCAVTEPVNNFTWKLTDNDSGIELSGFKSKIIVLTESKLVISPYDSISFPVQNFLIGFKR